MLFHFIQLKKLYLSRSNICETHKLITRLAREEKNNSRNKFTLLACSTTDETILVAIWSYHDLLDGEKRIRRAVRARRKKLIHKHRQKAANEQKEVSQTADLTPTPVHRCVDRDGYDMWCVYVITRKHGSKVSILWASPVKTRVYSWGSLQVQQ